MTVLLPIRPGAAHVIAFLAGFVGSIGTALASDDAGHAAPHHADPTDLLLPAVNFTIFAVIVARYVVPALREYLRRRSADIGAATQEAARALATAEREHADARQRLAHVGRESESIVRDMVAAAERQAERTRQYAEETGRRRLADAELVADQERRRALAQLREHVAAIAVDRAESRIRGSLTADDQRAFVRDFLERTAAR
jgi:F-type H+-transporting ATPase subunit b